MSYRFIIIYLITLSMLFLSKFFTFMPSVTNPKLVIERNFPENFTLHFD